MTTRRLILLRHGRTAWNAQHRFQGHADPPLDEVGRAQAYEVAAIIAAIRPDLMLSSSAARAAQTAEILAHVSGLPFTSDIRFRERGLGHWEGLTPHEVADAYPDEYAEWVAGKDVQRRGGETRDEVAARALLAFDELPDVGTTVLVTHGATAMTMCNALLGLSQQVHPLAALANCHWTELFTDRSSGREPAWRVRGHNLGAPGAVVPLPAHADAADETSDADA